MLKYIIMFFFLSLGVIFSQTSEQEYQQTRSALADMTIRWNDCIKNNENLAKTINALILDLQAIPNPSDTLIAIMKKYNIYKNVLP